MELRSLPVALDRFGKAVSNSAEKRTTGTSTDMRAILILEDNGKGVEIGGSRACWHLYTATQLGGQIFQSVYVQTTSRFIDPYIRYAATLKHWYSE